MAAYLDETGLKALWKHIKEVLSGKADKGDVGNGTVTITQGGTTKGTFAVNQSGNTTIALTDTNTDTHYTTRLKVGASASATANAAAGNGSVYLNVLDNSTVRDSHNIVGSGAATVVSDANGKITIHSTNTTYSALKNPNAIRIQDNGTDIQSYDGSAAKVLNFKAGNNITLDSTTGDTSTITINATTNSEVTPFIITVNFFDTLGEEDSPWYDKEYMEISHSDWESLRTKLGNGEAVSIIVKQAYNGNGDWYNETAFYARVDENDDYEFTKVTFYTLYPSGYAVYKYTIDETNGSGADGSGWHNVTKQQVSSVPTIPALLTAVGNTSVTTITSSIDYYIPSNAQRQFIKASSDFALVTHNLQNGLDYSVIVKNISADSIVIDVTAADMNGEMSYTLDSDAFIEFSFLYIGDEWIIRTLK